MLFIKKITLSFLIVFTAFRLNAQETCDEFVWGNKIYKPCAKWITTGYGKGYDFRHKTLETNGDISIHTKISKIYLQAGYHMSSKDFFLSTSNQKLNDIHIGIGKRIEKDKSNLAFFAGPSLAYGKTFFGTDTLGRSLTLSFTKPGLFANVQYTYKIFYDIGVGFTLYASINEEYPLIGLQAHLYFSGAYKGKIH